MSSLIKITTIAGSIEVIANTNDFGYLEFDLNNTRACEDLAIAAKFEFPNLLGDSVLYAINEGGVTSDSWSKEEGSSDNFSFEIISQLASSYIAIKQFDNSYLVNYFDYSEGIEFLVWSESFNTKEEVEISYELLINQGLLTFEE